MRRSLRGGGGLLCPGGGNKRTAALDIIINGKREGHTRLLIGKLSLYREASNLRSETD